MPLAHATLAVPSLYKVGHPVSHHLVSLVSFPHTHTSIFGLPVHSSSSHSFFRGKQAAAAASIYIHTHIYIYIHYTQNKQDQLTGAGSCARCSLHSFSPSFVEHIEVCGSQNTISSLGSQKKRKTD